ncbi:FadR/GntR family transcriptional regulator [Ruania halotolerans]|uniref:FadR/GntR family transcriptional regulator n=1 Tax=Ruania halotolerans TaxID=2897773 RepID=UPI001E416B13|nr:FadR/GntR family transcriptional regulator [Ruania halotolerans]UFU06886.1 FadR family transcriptional regulator [Ruania halotolerans]
MAVTDTAIETIKAMIVSGELRPGQRLPPEKELSERLGLSRNSLREAVKSLELIRVLDVRRGDGTYVTSLEPRLLLEAMSFVVDLHQDDSVLEIFEVRRLLEPHAAALAAARISEAELDALAVDLDGLPAEPSVEELVDHDVRFHAAITAAGGNAYLASLLDSLTSATVRARVWRGITQERVTDRTLAEHRAILDALRRRDAEMVRAVLTVHIGGVEAWLQRAADPDLP